MRQLASWILFPVLLGLCCDIPLARARLTKETLSKLVQGFGYDSQSETVAERYPYIASLRDPVSKGHICGGALVAPAVVLTAASCIDPAAGGTASPDVRLRARCENCVGPRQMFRIAKTVGSHIHPSWNGKVNAGHDMALVFLGKELPGPYLNVPAVAMPWTVVPNNHPMTFVGYYSKTSANRKEVLKESFLPFRSRADCLDIYKNHRLKLFVQKSFICAGGSGYKVCMDDLGGPLIIKGGSPEDDIAIGVLSDATTGSCWQDVSLPALFTSFAGLQEGLNIIKGSGPQQKKETLEPVSPRDPSTMDSPPADEAANPRPLTPESPVDSRTQQKNKTLEPVSSRDPSTMASPPADEGANPKPLTPDSPAVDEGADADTAGGEGEVEDEGKGPEDFHKDSSDGKDSSDSSAREDDDDDYPGGKEDNATPPTKENPPVNANPPPVPEATGGREAQDSSAGASSDSSAHEDDDDDHTGGNEDNATPPTKEVPANPETPPVNANPPPVPPTSVSAAERAAGFAAWLATLN